MQRKALQFLTTPLIYWSDLTPANFFLFPKMKSHLKGRHFDFIADIQTNMTRELNNISVAEFYTGIQKLYDRATRCIDLGAELKAKKE